MMSNSRPHRTRAVATALALTLVACSGSGQGGADPSGTPSPLASRCAPDNGSITLPEGFCAVLVTTALPGARHLAVAENGDLFVATQNRRVSRNEPILRGGVTVLRDLDGDGAPDSTATWGENGGNEVLLADGHVYVAPNDAVLRYPIADGSMTPSGPPDTVVSGLPDTGNHTAKSVALGSDGALYVNMGSASNACMRQTRAPGSPGQDPCPELDVRAGIWRFDPARSGQSEADGTRFATGMRNTVALSLNPADGALYGVIHGRDQLYSLWDQIFTVDQNAEMPAEEFVRIDEDDDYGWPYCFQDPATGKKLLAPEYGGDGTEVGRCAEKDMPIIGFPAHWAPDDLEFYTGSQFPSRYRGGAFIAFHGSWNRAPKPQEGYKVVFVPAGAGGAPGTDWEIFADDFVDFQSADESFRPVGLAVGPDGSLYVSDDVHGRIWRIVYRGT